MTFRIAITGPESTGKSTLAEDLAKHYLSPLIFEYAREYLNNLKHSYTYEDVEQIALEQIRIEDQELKINPEILISDTELLVIKVWMDHKFNKIPNWLEKKIISRKFDFYFLCDIDLPWQYDPLRENPHLQDYFLKIYKQELESRNFVFELISGDRQSRLEKAIKIIDSKIKF